MPAYYDRRTHNYWLQTSRNGWTPYTREALKIHLIEIGFSGRPGTAVSLVESAPDSFRELSRADQEISRITREQNIDIQCDVAGWPEGIHDMYGKRVLVQETPRLWTPEEGNWSFFHEVFLAVSRRHAIQYDVLVSWFKLGMIKIYQRKSGYTQALLMVGDTSSGKSLVHCMITILVGGGVANPIEWMLGGNFNRDCIEAEHLCLEEPSVTIRDRQKYLNRLKELVAVEARRCRGLYAEAVSLPPFQIVSGSSNTESDNIAVIPDMVKGIEDKFHVCFFPSGSMPIKGFEKSGQDAIKAVIRAQAPAFLWHLFNEYEIPDSLLTRVTQAPYDCQRFGMDAYHNPEVIDLVSERSNEAIFVAMFERLTYYHRKGQPFNGTTSKLSEWLREHTSDPDAVRLSKDTRLLGYLLRSLCKRFPEKFQAVRKTKMGIIWLILPDLNPMNEAEN
jgi:hypothetical protein